MHDSAHMRKYNLMTSRGTGTEQVVLSLGASLSVTVVHLDKDDVSANSSCWIAVSIRVHNYSVVHIPINE